MPGVFNAAPLRYCLQCVEFCAVIDLADLSHSAVKGDWRLLRFEEKGRKHDRITWQIWYFAKNLKLTFQYRSDTILILAETHFFFF